MRWELGWTVPTDAAAASPPPSTSPADQAGAHWELDSKLPRGCPEELENDNSNGLRASFGAWGEARGGWHQNPLYTPAPARAEQQAATGNDVARVDSSAELSAVTSTDGVAGSSERLDGTGARVPWESLCAMPVQRKVGNRYQIEETAPARLTVPVPPACVCLFSTCETIGGVMGLLSICTNLQVCGGTFFSTCDIKLCEPWQLSSQPAAHKQCGIEEVHYYGFQWFLVVPNTRTRN